MRLSRFFGECLREAPSGFELPGQQLLVRAGYIRQLAAGVFSHLPLAYRSLKKIEQIIREELDRIGGQEMTMPVVHPAELWQQSGRWEAVDQTMARFKDRADRDMLLAMTHEEVVARLASSEILSYRQLPQLIYQFQTKFRDEARPRGGLIRVREFVMKDSYSLDTTGSGLEIQYIAHYNAYFRIAARVGLPVIAVGSDVGMMGGKLAHEFMYVTEVGEDTLVVCSKCGYSANREVAQFKKEVFAGAESLPVEPLPVERVATPGKSTIEDLAAFLGVDPRQTAKALFYSGDFGPDKPERLVMAVVRGDMEGNPTRITALSGALAVRPAHDEEIRAAGSVPGYASPVGVDRRKVTVIVDDLVASSNNLVAGANEVGAHLLNTCCGRDYEPDVVGDIAAAFQGALCVSCSGPLDLTRGVEVGNIFQLGTRYSDALGATFQDETGERRPIVMGSYGIGLGRLLGCLAEEYRDDHGLLLPVSVAPFEVTLVVLPGRKGGEEIMDAAEKVYEDLRAVGREVLYDDRDLSPGVKFAEADLRGIPLRLTVSPRSLKSGGVEMKRRSAGDAEIVRLEQVRERVAEELAAMRAELESQFLQEVPVWEGNP